MFAKTSRSAGGRRQAKRKLPEIRIECLERRDLQAAWLASAADPIQTLSDPLLLTPVYQDLGQHVAKSVSLAAAPIAHQAQFQRTPVSAGNDPSHSRNLGRVNGHVSVRDYVGPDDQTNWYRFTITRNSGVYISLDGLQDDADIVVTNANLQEIGSSDNAGTRSEILSGGLPPGTYYICVLTYHDASTTYRLNMRVTPSEPGFQIDLAFANSAMSATQRRACQNATSLWSKVITGDVSDVVYEGRFIDDLRVQIIPCSIDGRGGILGGSVVEAVRSGSYLPCAGTIYMDTADLAALQRTGTLTRVITHEIGHLLGFGSIWGPLGLVRGIGTRQPVFTGRNTVAAYNQLFKTNARAVPLENSGGRGTRDCHWSEAVFDTELMTGYAEQGSMPLSRLTIASMADLGYQVNYRAAETYAPPRSAGRLQQPLSQSVTTACSSICDSVALKARTGIIASSIVLGARTASQASSFCVEPILA